MSFEISMDGAPILDIRDETVPLPIKFPSIGDLGAIAPGADFVGRPELAGTFDLTTDLGITAIIIGGLAVISVAGYLWMQPWIQATDFAITRTIGGIKAVEKMSVDVNKSLGKTFKGVKKMFK